MKPSRRKLLKYGGAFAFPMIWTSTSRAQTYTLKWGNAIQVGHPFNLRAAEAIKRIHDLTKGQVEVKLFPNAQLGGDTQLISQARTGALEICSTTGSIFGTLAPVAAITGLGYAFSSYRDVWKAVDGPVGALIRTSLGKAGLHTFEACADNGFRRVSSLNKEVQAPKDLVGFKIRVPVVPLYVSMFEKLRAAPVALNVNELYSALETKVVDGQEMPIDSFLLNRLNEVQNRIALTNHVWDGFWTTIKNDTWAKYPQNIQKVLTEAINDASRAQRDDSEKAAASVKRDLEAKNVKFNDVNSAAFRDALKSAGFYQEWRAKFGNEAMSVLENVVGKLG